MTEGGVFSKNSHDNAIISIMGENKNWWKRFNPTLKEMQEKNPNLSILGMWWAWYWRLAICAIVIAAAFAILASVIVLVFDVAGLH